MIQQLVQDAPVAIYEIRVEDGREWVIPRSDEDWKSLKELYNGPPRAGWRSPRVRALKEDEGRQLRGSDFPSLASQVLVLSEKACRELEGVLVGQGYLSRLDTEDGRELWVLAPNAYDCLDEENSRVVRSDEDGRVMVVLRPVFRAPVPNQARIWRLPYTSSPVFASEDFVNAVAEARLEGLEFRRVC